MAELTFDGHLMLFAAGVEVVDAEKSGTLLADPGGVRPWASRVLGQGPGEWRRLQRGSLPEGSARVLRWVHGWAVRMRGRLVIAGRACRRLALDVAALPSQTGGRIESQSHHLRVRRPHRLAGGGLAGDAPQGPPLPQVVASASIVCKCADERGGVVAPILCGEGDKMFVPAGHIAMRSAIGCLGCGHS